MVIAEVQSAIACADRVFSTLRDLHRMKEDFLGHIGGDDFVIISTPDRIQKIGEEIIRLLDSINFDR